MTIYDSGRYSAAVAEHDPPSTWPRYVWPTAIVAIVVVLFAVAFAVTGSDEPAASISDSAATSDSAASDGGSASPDPGETTATVTAEPPAPSPEFPARFTTLGPGATLPSGEYCAAAVRATPYPENKGANRIPNATTGHKISANFYTGSDKRSNTLIASRVDGQFTGTTGQILRWAACKWGVDEDLVFAQAAVESWWQQSALGDFGTTRSRCAPGRGLGVDGQPGKCPESFGILQNRYPYNETAWPGIVTSTAMNADLAYATFRVCFEGYETWLNTVERGREYTAGDVWGCVGRHMSGRWYVAAGNDYVAKVQNYLNQRIWTTPNFQQP